MQANCEDPDQTSGLGLHYSPMSQKKDARHIWVRNTIILLIS